MRPCQFILTQRADGPSKAAASIKNVDGVVHDEDARSPLALCSAAIPHPYYD